MTAEWWKVAYWMVATFGVVGTIALAAFAPTVFPLVARAVVRCFSLVLSYRVGCALVAAVLAAVITDYIRHDIEDKKHAALNAAFEQAQVDRDKRIRTETRELVWKEIANATAENAVTDKDVKDFTDELPPSPPTGNLFRVGDDAVRLRKLAGQAERGHRSAQGVPQADAKPASLRDRIRKRLSGSGGGSVGSNQQGEQSAPAPEPLR